MFIISLLASMLMPALNSAIGAARKMRCVGNLKQLGQGYIMFVEESNKSRTPPMGHWKPEIWPYVESGREYADVFGWTVNHRKFNTVFLCPEGVGRLDRYANAGNNNITYIQGMTGGADWPTSCISPRGVYGPSKAILNYCAWKNHWNITQPDDPCELLPNTHKDGRPVLYYDGHVQVHREWVNILLSASKWGIPSDWDNGRGPYWNGWDSSKVEHVTWW